MLRIRLLILLFFSAMGLSHCQESFRIKKDRKSTRIKFELVNNLIIVPVELNGLQLSFLVDTGVKTTLLLNLDSEDTTMLNPAEKVNLRGLGGEELIEAYRSRDNYLKIGNVSHPALSVFVVYDDNINFSPRLGVPVHGIIGYDLFKDFVVEINYPKRFLRLHDPLQFDKKLGGFEELPLAFFQDKPYITCRLQIDGKESLATLLLDNGLSDAVWLFPDSTDIQVPLRSFPDFLGLGLLGDVSGSRAKLDFLQMGSMRIEQVNASFPDSLSVDGLQTYHARNGSIGSEIMRRFHLFFDYGNSRLFLKKNQWFDEPFHFNMSGIVLEHNGFTVVESYQRVSRFGSGEEEDNVLVIEPSFYKKFELQPAFKVARLRENSPAALAGLQPGDEVVKINGRNAYKFDLNDFVSIFSSELGKSIQMEIRRGGMKMTFRFKLEEPL